MKGNTLKPNRSKKQVKRIPPYEKYQLKNRANVFAILMATIFILIAVCWILTVFGLGLSCYLFKNDHPVWASLIIIIDVIIVRSYIKTKP